ncbi:MAG: aldehyde dehydrogenase [Spirochaetales bacterium]|nr:aldehyde dehydrogenase [Spirochaetales bacterium]
MEYKEMLMRQKQFFNSGITRSVKWRKSKLKVLYKAIKNYQTELLAALKNDLNKSPVEAFSTEIGIILEEISFALKHLSKWVKTEKVPSALLVFPSRSKVYHEPYGTVLILSPWNYPVQLALMPLVGAIAAGNCAVIKPSEDSPASSKIVAEIIKSCFEPEFVDVVLGDKTVSESLLKEKFDYIFFTGSPAIGKIVMKAAAENLIPVTLELGGKSPCIVDETADIQVSAKRIAWGKFINAGQTCVAPDYLLVQKSIKEKLLSAIEKEICAFYTDTPENNPEYPRIINKRHFLRLCKYFKDGKVICGARANSQTLQIAPTLLDDVNLEASVMKEEIFGPVLPVVTFDKFHDAIQFVNDRPRPLALYFFSSDKNRQHEIIEKLSFGGGCINDTILHLVTPYMPFGGIGNSGMGSYHGKNSFETFSHRKSILHKSFFADLWFRYPPYSGSVLKLLMKIMK